MKRNKIIAVVLAVALIGSLAGVSAFAAGKQSDNTAGTPAAVTENAVESSAIASSSSETVYVIANADGSAQKVVVSQKYAADDANAAQEAKTTLTDPQNVKGDNCWQGTTDKPLPVTIAVTYTLDGKTVTAAELAGKSGHVTMRFDYTNTQYETKTINGKSAKIYVPFAVLTGALLDSDRFTNVSVTNGKLVDDGDHTIVVGMAFPGLQESLDLDTDTLEIPAWVEVEADVTDFTLDTTLTVVTNSVFNDVEEDDLDSSALDDLSADMDKLTDAMEQLMDGSDELYDGLNTLLSSSYTLSDGVGQLTSGLKTLDSNSAQLNAGAETVFNTLLDTVNTQLKANQELAEAVGEGNMPTLTISSYYDELSKLINLFDRDQVVAKATQIAREKVTAKVDANMDTIRTKVTTVVETSVTQQVTAIVQENVTAQVTAGVRQKVQDSVMASLELTTAYDALDQETKAQVDAAVDQQMASNDIQQTIAATVKAQMDSDDVKATITAQVNEQMASETVQQLLEAKVQEARQQAIEEAMLTEEVQNPIQEAAAKAGAATQQLLAVRQQLDSYNVFYKGLRSYTAGVAEAAAGAVKLNSSMPDLISGVKKLRDGAGELADGLKELNEEGIQKLVDAFDGDLSQLSDRLSALRDVSRAYQGFTTQSDSGVKFIFRTAAIESED